MKSLCQYFDHTILKPDATEEDIRQLCHQAKEYQFFAVCVNSSYVELAKTELDGSNVKVVAVVGFPLGACATEVKVFETEWVCNAGADEVDMVLHVGAMKEGRFDYVFGDIKAVVAAAQQYGGIVKVILETCLLTDQEIVQACRLAESAGAAFVKTSTGFSEAGATEAHVTLMRQSVGKTVSVKASGGIRTYNDVLRLIEAGADRIGASACVAIVDEALKRA